MVGSSGQGPRPSSFNSAGSDLWDDESTLSPSFSWMSGPTWLQENQQPKHQQAQRPPPPPYQFEDPRANERTSLLSGSEHGRQGATDREIFSLSARWSQRGFRDSRRPSRTSSGPCAVLLMVLFSTAAVFMIGIGLSKLWQWEISSRPTPAPLPTYTVAIIGVSPAVAPFAVCFSLSTINKKQTR